MQRLAFALTAALSLLATRCDALRGESAADAPAMIDPNHETARDPGDITPPRCAPTGRRGGWMRFTPT